MRRERLYKVVNKNITIEVRSIPSRSIVHGRDYYALAFDGDKPCMHVPLHKVEMLLLEGTIINE